MQLDLHSYRVSRLELAKRTELNGEELKVGRDELRELILSDGNISNVDVDIAEPGDSTRIVHVIDIIEPRAKAGGGEIFPGFLGPGKTDLGSGKTVGIGITLRLEGVALVLTTDIEAWKSVEGPSSLNGPRERVIDMNGPAAQYSPFSQTRNIVLSFSATPGVSLEEIDNSIRIAGLKAAERIAKAASGSKPSRKHVYKLSAVDASLPRVVYICQLASDGIFRDTFLYGEYTRYLNPTLIHPNELMDGAIVNGSLSYASSPTYVHCNNKVVEELYSQHGKTLNFAGVVLTGRHHLTHSHKSKRAHYSAKLAKLLHADGAVLTQEGGGNSIVDQMLTCQFCEEIGIKTAVITYEMGGVEGTDFPLIFQVKEADAIVSTGNREARIRMPAMKRAIGGDKIIYDDVPADGEYEAYMTDIAFSFDQTGYWRVRGWQY